LSGFQPFDVRPALVRAISHDFSAFQIGVGLLEAVAVADTSVITMDSGLAVSVDSAAMEERLG
jgi:hypothetical protein